MQTFEEQDCSNFLLLSEQTRLRLTIFINIRPFQWVKEMNPDYKPKQAALLGYNETQEIEEKDTQLHFAC